MHFSIYLPSRVKEDIPKKDEKGIRMMWVKEEGTKMILLVKQGVVFMIYCPHFSVTFAIERNSRKLYTFFSHILTLKSSVIVFFPTFLYLWEIYLIQSAPHLTMKSTQQLFYSSSNGFLDLQMTRNMGWSQYLLMLNIP